MFRDVNYIFHVKFRSQISARDSLIEELAKSLHKTVKKSGVPKVMCVREKNYFLNMDVQTVTSDEMDDSTFSFATNLARIRAFFKLFDLSAVKLHDMLVSTLDAGLVDDVHDAVGCNF